jgi:light-regulated signal transduction histidine kinase (bacteriophytochrome)
MERLINALLNFSRLGDAEIKREQVDLSSMAREILAEYSSREPERKVQTIVQEGITVEGDQSLLLVLLDNLLGNAWKYTGKTEVARIEFGSQDAGGRKVYFVRDNGAGFDMNYVDKLFGVFQRLHSDQDFKGEGIGLATVQRIIFRHGGCIWAEAAPNQGATFYFSLEAARSTR